MGRFYSIPLSTGQGTAGTVAQDLFEILAASAKPFVLHEIVLGQNTEEGDAQAEMLGVLIKRATGSFNAGSGGQTVTPAKHLTNDQAAGATAEVCNTSQATAGSGALTLIRQESWNVQAGYQYLPTPEQRIIFAPTEACVISLEAPADSTTFSGTVVIEEIG